MQMIRTIAIALVGVIFATGVTSPATTPVKRVVELLQQLSGKIEATGKNEEELFNKFICWGKSVVSAKTASNAEANARITELENYIADMDAGRVEFTSERTDLEKEIGTLRGDIESADATRAKEQQDFQMAAEDMSKGITALEDAIKVLEDATRDSTGIALLSKHHTDAEVSLAEQSAQRASLRYAADLGEKFLEKIDSLFLRKLLTGDVPDAPKRDWKKLNRKATWKLSYKARSDKILGVLKGLLQTFETNLAEATNTDSSADDLYKKVTSAKSAQRGTAQQELQALAHETDTKGLNRAEASQERNNLAQIVTDDTKFIQQTQTAMATKTSEWQDRRALRTGELAAMSKAIAILNNDDSKDLLKKSFASQGFSFIQQGSNSLRDRASEMLRKAAEASHDSRLRAFAQLAAKGNFDLVISEIDNMVQLLTAEEADDLKNKEDCEHERARATREAILLSRDIDGASDTINNLQAEIDKLEAQIKDLEEEKRVAEAEYAEASRIRSAENQAFQNNKQDDEDAASTVGRAIAVLQEFYTSNNLISLTQATKKNLKQAAPGDAPVPPPATWDTAAYGGKTEEATGIISLLTLVKEDIEKDTAKATSDEGAAQTKFNEFEAAIKEKIEVTLTGDIAALAVTRGERQQSKLDTTGDRTLWSGDLKQVMKGIKDAEPGCNFFTINYPLRFKNRQIEMDSLLKAKAILSRAEFDNGPDPNRELRPGDAFLQRRLLRAHL